MREHRDCPICDYKEKIEAEKEPKKLDLKPFDKNDWDAFAGASGDDPKICWDVAIDKGSFPLDFKDDDYFFTIVDSEVIILYIDKEDGETRMAYVLETNNQYLGEVIAEGLTYPFNYNELIKLGFKPNDF